MRTIRRLYFYAVALISLEVVLWGVIGLLRSIFSTQLIDTTDVLSQALALVLVGLPIFLFHWLWSQRTAAKDEEEHSASLRAIFFYAVLLGTMVPVAQNLLAWIDRGLLNLVNVSASRAFLGGFQTWQDNLIAILVNSIMAFYFWATLRGVWKSLSDSDNFADVRRLYRYLWLLYSLLMVVFGTQQILRYVFYLPVPDYMLGGVGAELFANGLALLVVGTPLWVYVWRICQDALSVPAEQKSNLRLGVLYVLALGSVITVLSAGGTLLDVILRWAFGEHMAGGDFLKEIGGPISLGVPLGGIWAYYGGWLKHHIELDQDATRRASKNRLYSYILSALGLGATFIGIAMVLSFVIDLGFGDFGSVHSESMMRNRIATSIATLVVGLPLWLLTWRPLQAGALAEGDAGDHARRSTIRRTYLYLALFVGVIGGMASAVGLVYLLINTLLTQKVDSDFWSQLLNLLQLLVLFVVLLVYHLSSLRRDGAQASQTLETRQREFPVLVIDSGREVITNTIAAAMSKHAPDVPVVVKSVDESVKAEDVKAVILPASLVLNPPDALQKWLKKFEGERLVVAEAVPGWVLTALTPEQAAQSARQVAEGEEVHLAVPSPVWRVIQTVAVIVVGLEVLLFLLALGISFIAG